MVLTAGLIFQGYHTLYKIGLILRTMIISINSFFTDGMGSFKNPGLMISARFNDSIA